MNVKQLLGEAFRLIETEQRWCRGAVAKTATGLHCLSRDLDAVQFCSLGALKRAQHNLNIDDGETFGEAVILLETKISPDRSISLIDFNDHNDYETVRSLWLRVLNG